MLIVFQKKTMEIPDVAAYASECLLGILRVPTEHLFCEAITVSRRFEIV